MPSTVRLYVLCTGLLAAGALGAAFLVAPPPPGPGGIVALASLTALAVVSHGMGIQVDEEGTRTSFDFVVHLAAVQLVGPFGAGVVGGLGSLLYQATSTDKPPVKVVFNGFQFALAGTAAGFVFLATGGVPSLEAIGFPESLIPFFAAAAADAFVNTLAVTGIVSVTQGVPLLRTLRNLKGPLILFDLTFSILGYGIAALYVTSQPWGPVALALAIVPLLGLRYFYGMNIELRNLSRDLTRVLVRTIEAQDPYTSGHSVRVSEYARRIAEKLGLDYERIRQVETAALLHDIGKIDRAYRTILAQDGPLTDEQRELIHAHPERGAELLEPVRALDDEVMEMIRHHHERWDGDGYPGGVEGEQIPVGARIIMVADTVDAMMTSRSYRDPLRAEDVRRELRMLKREQFDPEVVDAALEIGIVKEAAAAQDDPEVGSDPDQAVQRPS